MQAYFRRALLSVLFLQLFNETNSQCTLAGADNCEDSPIFCSLNEMNGYSCKNIDYLNTSACSPLCPSGGAAI